MKIAIQFGTGYKSVEATPIEIEGIKAAVHKTPSAKGGACFAVTCPVTGLAFAKRSTRKAAIELATERIVRAGTWQVQAKLNASNRAPAVDTLEPLVIEPKPSTPAVDVASIVDLIAKAVGGLTDRERAAVLRALNSRTGQLKAKSPSAFGDADERLACAAWQGIQPNPFKCGIGATLFIAQDPECSVLLEKLNKVKWPAAFDKDKLALVEAGVW